MADQVLSAGIDELKSQIASLGEIINDEFPKGAGETPFAKSVRVQVSDIMTQVLVVERAAGLVVPVPGSTSNPRPVDFVRVAAESVGATLSQ